MAAAPSLDTDWDRDDRARRRPVHIVLTSGRAAGCDARAASPADESNARMVGERRIASNAVLILR